MQPRAIPKNVVVFKEAELPPEPPPGSGVFGGVDSLLGGLGEGATGVAPPPLRSASREPRSVAMFRTAKVIARPNPIYPRSPARRAFRAKLRSTRSLIRTGA